MFEFWKKRRIERITEAARSFLQRNYEPPKNVLNKENKFKYSRDIQCSYSIEDEPQFSMAEEEPEKKEEPKVQYSLRDDGVRYSLRAPASDDDKYDTARVAMLMRNSTGYSSQVLSKALGGAINQTFTYKLIDIINQKGLRDADVYKAAQMDRRLFSKIMSDRDFKPAKDTALALVFALKLTLPQATDLLSRAGYTLSHSSKRDVILEYFIREGIYNLTDINIVLDNLEQKIIGR